MNKYYFCSWCGKYVRDVYLQENYLHHHKCRPRLGREGGVMTVTYSDPQKNADINKSKAALVEIIDDLRKRFARKNDEWSEAEALAASRLKLLREMHEVIVNEPLVCPVCGVSGCRDDGLCELAEELGE